MRDAIGTVLAEYRYIDDESARQFDVVEQRLRDVIACAGASSAHARMAERRNEPVARHGAHVARARASGTTLRRCISARLIRCSVGKRRLGCNSSRAVRVIRCGFWHTQRGEPLALDCDAQALFPELARQIADAAGASAPAVDRGSLRRLAVRTRRRVRIHDRRDRRLVRYGAAGRRLRPVLTHPRGAHRAAHFAFDSEAVDQWLKRQPVPMERGEPVYRSRLLVPVPVCMAGPR